ncbi:hypothetical protein [Bilophila wadsworthia]|uniref:hypothetical protein n=1 Tax=Bilophila wadsworthia TaxID=35833 RepID=UPI003520717E
MYYAIDETAARIAHNMNSFYAFQQGKVTEEYRKLVDAAAALAAEKKNCVDSMFHAKIDALLDAYSRKLADWYNKGLAIESRCPSVMIAGPSNFPIRKKEKQNAARDKHMRDYERIKALLTKIAATGTGSIRSDDPDALAKLKSKRASLEQSHADMKAVNAYYHKHKTLDGCPGLTDEMRRALERYTGMGFIPTYRLSYNLAEIKRVKQRIAELERRAENPFQGWMFDGGEVVANAEANRLQIIFADKPGEVLRGLLKKRGFKWSPRFHAWQRQLTSNAVHAAKEILKANL